MPFGTNYSICKLGISNPTSPNGLRFAQTVLRLPSNTTNYQQHIAHSQYWAMGPDHASTDCCGTNCTCDTESEQAYTLREISAHDTVFARRNIGSANAPNFSLLSHRARTSNQMYYLDNEPEVSARLRTFSECHMYPCWSPRNRIIDSYVSSDFPNPADFWEAAGAEFAVASQACWSTTDTPQRATAEALALVYLKMRQEILSLNRGHVLLPPSSAAAQLGQTDTYWQRFFDRVHSATLSPKITPSELGTLHIHQYSYIQDGEDPILRVAYDATRIRMGADWYRHRYVGVYPASLPVDIAISEMGPNWQGKGGFNLGAQWTNYVNALTWWNTYLCWITRRAPTDCKLATGKSVYALIHDPCSNPFGITSSMANTSRSQTYLNVDTLQTAQTIVQGMTGGMSSSVGLGGLTVYEQVATSYPSIFLPGMNGSSCSSGVVNSEWLITPMAACYSVWSRVGGDDNTNNLNTGWVINNTGGNSLIGTASVISIPSGWSTVYIPVIKLSFTNISSILNIRWVRGGSSRDHGTLRLGDFYNAREVPVVDYPAVPGVTGSDAKQNIYTSMVYPIVCYSAQGQSVTIEARRNVADGLIALGRPIVLPGICTWFSHQ